ncbi:MAG TPA: lactate racemase domain-containing protein [Kofleriaceae bacterium]|nr:lactate racemase domain-containing protein [Kofleriaceae bacterium]
MGTRLALDYGQRPRWIELPDGARVVRAPTPDAPAPSVDHLLDAALAAPIGAAPLEQQARAARRILVVVSDHTRSEPRAAMVAAVLSRIPAGAELTFAAATGTHGPTRLDWLQRELEPALPPTRAARWLNHDGGDRDSLVSLGTTRRGTPVLVNRALLDADLVVATGCIIPHYFAGYGAGCKALFPGLGGSIEIRINHAHKQEPGARAGVVDGNPCRDDLEEAAALVPGPVFLLNAVLDDDGATRAAVAGDTRLAFRAGAALCEPLYRVRAPTSRRVVVSGRLPVTGSLYQASKLVAAAAPLVAPGGTVILVAECGQGTGPVATVNEAIYAIGIKPRLPADHRVVLVSDLSPATVEQTYCEWAPSVEAALAAAGSDPPTVLPRAGSLLVEAEP